MKTIEKLDVHCGKSGLKVDQQLNFERLKDLKLTGKGEGNCATHCVTTYTIVIPHRLPCDTLSATGQVARSRALKPIWLCGVASVPLARLQANSRPLHQTANLSHEQRRNRRYVFHITGQLQATYDFASQFVRIRCECLNHGRGIQLDCVLERVEDA